MDGSLSTDAIVLWHVLSVFADHKTGVAWPSMGTIQLACKMGRNRVHNAIAELVAAKAISRELKKRRSGRAIYGSTAYYTVTPLHKWVTKKHVLETPERPVLGTPITGLPEINHEHIPTKEHIPTPEQLLNTSPRPGSGMVLSLSLPETESLLADWGFDASVASMSYEKMAAGNWTDRNGRPFPNMENLHHYVIATANKINADRTGLPYAKIVFQPSGGSGEKYAAPVATNSQNDWREPDNDGPQDA